MKKRLAIWGLFLIGSVASAEPPRAYDRVEVDFAESGAASVVLQCDDSFYSGIDLVLPFQVRAVESYVSFAGCGVDWKLISTKTNQGKTILRFDGATPCDLDVLEKVKPPQRPRHFKVEISDAC